MAVLPLVSCIMPTRDRRMFVSQSIAYFLRQDYSYKELVLVDDGKDCIIEQVPRNERTGYIRLPEPLPLGTKRNLACEQSKGDWSAYWDDDRSMASDCLTSQIHYICLNTKQSLSTNRNLACEAVAGEIVVGWHDDGWLGCIALLIKFSICYLMQQMLPDKATICC